MFTGILHVCLLQRNSCMFSLSFTLSVYLQQNVKGSKFYSFHTSQSFCIFVSAELAFESKQHVAENSNPPLCRDTTHVGTTMTTAYDALAEATQKPTGCPTYKRLFHGHSSPVEVIPYDMSQVLLTDFSFSALRGVRRPAMYRSKAKSGYFPWCCTIFCLCIVSCSMLAPCVDVVVTAKRRLKPRPPWRTKLACVFVVRRVES